MIVHPPRAGAPAGRGATTTGAASATTGATTTYVAAADVLSLRLAADPSVRTSVVRCTAGRADGPAPAPAIDVVLVPAGELLVGLVVEDASQWLPAAALEAATGTPVRCELTPSGRLWLSLVPEAPATWRTATRVVLPSGSLAVQLLWAAPDRLVAVEVEDVGRLHPSVPVRPLQAAEG